MINYLKRTLNYERKLMAMKPIPLQEPVAHFSEDDLKTRLSDITNIVSYKAECQKLVKYLGYDLPSWLLFGCYGEYCCSVKMENGKYQLFYCERGGWRLDADCDSLVELTYVIFNQMSPFTESANMLLAQLDRIKDQRLVIWLKMSSKIYQAFRINNVLGMRKLNENVRWMTDELVRMHVFETHEQAISSENHILQGLMLSGMPESFARHYYKVMIELSY